MARTSGTRVGNGVGKGPAQGAGYGGPANPGYRPPIPFSADRQPSLEAKLNGREAAKSAREIAIAHAVEAMLGNIADMRDPAVPPAVRVQARKAVIEHAEGTPIARNLIDLNHSGSIAGGGVHVYLPSNGRDEEPAAAKGTARVVPGEPG